MFMYVPHSWILHGGVDPDLAQVADDRLGHFLIVQVPSVWGLEHEVESFGISGLGQKFLGLFRVVRVGFYGRIVSEMLIG